MSRPSAEPVEVDFGFYMNTEREDTEGVILRVQEASTHILIGELTFSRADLGDLLSARSIKTGRWRDWRRS